MFAIFRPICSFSRAKLQLIETKGGRNVLNLNSLDTG